jgi:hypothetical protein
LWPIFQQRPIVVFRTCLLRSAPRLRKLTSPSVPALGQFRDLFESCYFIAEGRIWIPQSLRGLQRWVAMLLRVPTRPNARPGKFGDACLFKARPIAGLRRACFSACNFSLRPYSATE